MKKIVLLLALLCCSATAVADLKEGVLAYQRRDWDRAIPELKEAATAGSPEAAALLSDFYYNQDDDEAVRWSLVAATNGTPEMQYKMGVRIDRIAFRLSRRSDKRSSAFFLKAAECFRLGAESNYAPAQNSLGMLYEMGGKIPQDVKKGVHLYYLAAKQGDGHALTSLAAMYQGGRGVKRNPYTAYVLYSAAIKQKGRGYDIEYAEVSLPEVAKQISQRDIDRANKLVAAWEPGKPLPGLY